MDPDLALKILLIVSISFAIVGIAIYLMRLLDSVKKLVDESTKVVTDASEISGTVADGVRAAKKAATAGSFFGGLLTFASSSGVLKQIKKWLKRQNSVNEEESENDTSEKTEK